MRPWQRLYNKRYSVGRWLVEKDVEVSGAMHRMVHGGELERLLMVRGVMPDEELMEALESERKGKRDDYPIRPVWNSILAGIIYQHPSIESLRRELLRNGELSKTRPNREGGVWI